MSRLLTALAVVLLLLLGLAVLTWYLAFGTGPDSAGDAAVPGLGAPVTITYDAYDVPTIAAENEPDLFAGLGYVHALHSAWPMALWRQAATGSLSAWFDDSTALVLDRHALALGFDAFARATYESLSEDEQAVLAAYTRGVNRAFESARLSEGDEFVLLDVHARRWEPWDALAVERLVAYLATPPLALADSVAAAAYRASPPLRQFVRADSTFRRALGIEGLEHSLAFTLSDSTGTRLVQRHVYGSSALPLLREVVLRRAAGDLIVASIPGTLAVPAGVGERAWSVFLSGTASLVATRAPVPPPAYDRIVHRDGDETLVTLYRQPGALVLHDPAAPRRPVPRDTTGLVSDTLGGAAPMTWQLRWSGLEPGTDLSAWRALLGGGEPAFALFPGAGLVMEPDGQARVLGSPAVVRSLPGGVFAGMHPLADHVAVRVSMLDGEAGIGPEGLLADAYSTWAAALAPSLIGVLGGPGQVDADLRDASAYLRGWDFRYAPSSIGASIFSRWMAMHQEATGTLPDPAAVGAPLPPPDSLGQVAEPPAVVLAKRTLRLALERMQEEFGTNWAQWRWQNVQDATLTYPFFEARPGRFAPFHVPDGGHPTALAWGPSEAFSTSPASVAWAASASTAGGPALHVRHRSLYGTPRATLRPDDPVDTRSIARDAAQVRTVRLSPSER